MSKQINTKFHTTQLKLDYSPMFQNITRLFDRVNQTMEDLNFELQLMSQYIAITRKYTKSCQGVKLLTKQQPHPDNREVQSNLLIKFIKDNSNAVDQQFDYLQTYVKEATKEMNKIVKESNTMAKQYQKQMGEVFKQREALKQIEANTKAQYSKQHVASEEDKKKIESQTAKMEKSQQKSTQKLQTFEQKVDKQIKTFLERLEKLDKDRIVLIFRTNEALCNTIFNSADHTILNNKSLASFHTDNTMQQFLDEFIAKNKSDITTYATTRFTSQDSLKVNPNMAATVTAQPSINPPDVSSIASPVAVNSTLNQESLNEHDNTLDLEKSDKQIASQVE